MKSKSSKGDFGESQIDREPTKVVVSDWCWFGMDEIRWSTPHLYNSIEMQK